LYKTEKWEYHKVIHKVNPLRVVVSGRSPDFKYIGYTVFSPPSAPTINHWWEQNTEPASLCVLSDNMPASNNVIIASSLQNIVTLSPVTLPPVTGIAPSSYHFTLSSSQDKYCVQDVLTIEENNNIRISVAGYMIRGALPTQYHAWHGYVSGLSVSSSMRNNNYYGSITDRYQSYKVRYHGGETYTGGFFQAYQNYGGVLFGTPLKVAPTCDNLYPSLNTTRTPNHLLPQPIVSVPYITHNLDFSLVSLHSTYSTVCTPFKGEEPAPEMTMLMENKSEITAYYDRITVKDIPVNTNYQIYSVTGQLIQTGTTNPDISTAQLSKGLYILRLEAGKAFKFVK
jgi:hypothetical protein